MRRIPLTQGKFALIDNEDFERLNQFKWHCHKKDNRGKRYWRACRMPFDMDHKKVVIIMHREVLKYNGSLVVDHINGDSLDNRKENLRLISPFENNHHRIGNQKNNSSGFRGIYFFTSGNRTKRWTGSIKVKGKRYNLPYFSTKEEAYKAWVEKTKELKVPL